jgi:uncharacterized protein YlzI (FlbEa/FlbD family)
VEHTISQETIECFEEYIEFIKENPDVVLRLNTFKSSVHKEKE